VNLLSGDQVCAVMAGLGAAMIILGTWEIFRNRRSSAKEGK
jgi:hypothetical protein